MGGLEDKLVISGKRRNAFVASGGGLKALFFHIGVCMRLEKAGFRFKGGVSEKPRTEMNPPGEPGNKDIDLYVGSSGGALDVMGMALGNSPQEMCEMYMDDEKLEKGGLKRGVWYYVGLNTQAFTELGKSFRRALNNGIHPETFSIMSPIDLKPLEKRLHRFLETEDFRRVRPDLFIVTTPLNFPKKMGRIVYCRKDYEETDEAKGIIYRNDADISSAVTASSSLQFFHPFCVQHKNGEKIDGVDGETRKTLSYKIASDHGADLVFISYTHVPYSFDELKGSLKKYGIIRVAIQSIYMMIEERIQASKELNKVKNKAYDFVNGVYDEFLQEFPEIWENRGHREELEKRRESSLRKCSEELDIRRGVDYIFITPDEKDNDFFFDWHMGMSKDYIKRMVRKGYEATDRELKKYEFKEKSLSGEHR